MLEQSQQLSHTEDQFTDIYENIEVAKQSVTSIYDTVRNMDQERLTVVELVQKLSEIAADNAAGTQEILASSEMLDGMVKDVSEASGQLVSVSDDIEKSVSGFTV